MASLNKVNVLLSILEEEHLKDVHYQEKPANWLEHGFIATATSLRHINSLYPKFKKAGLGKVRIAGRGSSEWTIFEFNFCILHVFTEESREYYSLEELWKEGFDGSL